jgi:hypothetical protein
MKMVCPKDELNALYRERDNIKKFKLCQRKVFKMIAKQSINNNGICYSQNVSEKEQNYLYDTNNSNFILFLFL